MGSSYVTTLKTLEEGCVFYSGLIANPSTGKTAAMNIVKKGLLDIEKFLKISPDKSKSINGNY